MPRVPVNKELSNTRLANDYGGWMYCEGCNQTIGYLCYITYDYFKFDYECKCGGRGSVCLSFLNGNPSVENLNQLVKIKNRWCCPSDQTPLLSIVEKNLNHYKCEVVCKSCNSKFMKEQTIGK